MYNNDTKRWFYPKCHLLPVLWECITNDTLCPAIYVLPSLPTWDCTENKLIFFCFVFKFLLLSIVFIWCLISFLNEIKMTLTSDLNELFICVFTWRFQINRKPNFVQMSATTLLHSHDLMLMDWQLLPVCLSVIVDFSQTHPYMPQSNQISSFYHAALIVPLNMLCVEGLAVLQPRNL